jgi:hypothetical protein
MCVRNRRNKPAGMIPIGMMFLVFGILWQMLIHPAGRAARNWSEAVRGMLFGISIGINLLSYWILRRRRSRIN